jgi:hypothetical protein
MTIIRIKNSKEALLVLETYPTIKKRIFDNNAFIEVTFEDGKLLMNKSIIEEVGDAGPNKKSKIIKKNK